MTGEPGLRFEEIRAVLSQVAAAWAQVTAASALESRSLRIAGVDVDVVVAGAELAGALLPAFHGLEAASGPPHGTAGAWDAEVTGVGFPDRSPIDRDGPYRCLVRRDGRPVAELQWPSADELRTGDRDARCHLLAVRRASARSPWELHAPLRRQLSWVLGHEVLFVHAAAVGSPEGAALIMGPSGAGKSSTSLACLRAGMGFLSDDYCLVRDDPPVVHRLYATARLLDDELPYVDDFIEPAVLGGSLRDADPGAKALFFLHGRGPASMLASAPVRVVLVPERGHERRPRLEPIRAAEALRLVAPSALWQMSIEPDRDLAGLRALVAAVPCFRLVLSPDRHANPPIVQEALDRAANLIASRA